MTRLLEKQHSLAILIARYVFCILAIVIVVLGCYLLWFMTMHNPRSTTMMQVWGGIVGTIGVTLITGATVAVCVNAKQFQKKKQKKK
ncbi:MAG TPA: hypothetical protein VJJ82_02050 [Candidatus Nanoarchaeia archaeon]|nr:hypothetical protein [Candidatus Nanoarchaeia archaeon]